MNRFSVLFVMAITATGALSQAPQQSATDLAFDMYQACVKDFSTSCVQPKAMKWFKEVIRQNEISITDSLSIIRTGQITEEKQERAMVPEERIFQEIDNFLVTHALRMKTPEYFQTSEARSMVPDFLLNNALTNGAVVPLAEHEQGRGFIRKAVLPFLIGLKLKTAVFVPLALALIALKTWKAMTLGLLSLVLSGALVVFKIAKPKIVNYEVVHYPHHEHIEHIVPHHVEHIVPHHIEHIVPHHFDHHLDHHVDHHLDHHLDIPHHVEHIEHLEHAAPAWDPHGWARSSSQENHADAQDMAFAGQKRR